MLQCDYYETYILSFVGTNSFQVTKQTQKRIVEYFRFVAQNDRLLGIRFYIRNVQVMIL